MNTKDSIYGPFYRLIHNSVIKRYVLAESLETEESHSKYIDYRSALNKTDGLQHYEKNIMDDEFLEFFDIYNKHKTLSDEEQRTLLDVLRKRRIESYVELNPYYRMIMGLRDLDDPTVILVDAEMLEIRGVPTRDICDLRPDEILRLRQNGGMDKLIKNNPKRKYLTYLHRRANLITAREAKRFELIVVGNTSNINAPDLFRDKYNKFLEIFMRDFYNSFYHNNTQFYESLMITYLCVYAINDCVTEMYQSSGMDFYNMDDVKNILIDHGIPFEDSMPSDILSNLARSVDLLIRYAGSDRVFKHLSRVFNTASIHYYIIQQMYDFEGNKFIAAKPVPVNKKGALKEVLSREDNYIDFHSLVEFDKSFEKVYESYEELMSRDFSYINTKYLSIESIVDLSRVSTDMSLFFGFLMEYKNFQRRPVIIHRIIGQRVSLMDLYCYLVTLVSTKRGFNDTIPIYSDEMDFICGLNVNLSEKELHKKYLELKRIFEEEYAYRDLTEPDSEYGRLLMDKFKFFEERNDETDLHRFMDTFYDDREVMHVLERLMSTTYDYGRYRVVRDVYETMFFVKANNDTFKLKDGSTAQFYRDIIYDYNPALFDRLMNILVTDKSLLEDTINNEINYIIHLLNELVKSLDDPKLLGTFDFMDGFRDTEMSSIKEIMSLIIRHLITYSVTLTNTETMFVLGGSEILRMRETLSKTGSFKKEHLGHMDTILIPERNVKIEDTIRFSEQLIIYKRENDIVRVEDTRRRVIDYE